MSDGAKKGGDKKCEVLEKKIYTEQAQMVRKQNYSK